jgi:hypothetical protein
MYAFVEKATDKAIVIFRFEDLDAALKVFESQGVSVLSADTVAKL